MARRSPSSIYLVPMALVALGLGARAIGLGWGLPEVFEEAYPLKVAVRMWGFGEGGPDLNPHFFRYPSLVFYLEFIVVGILRVVLDIAGVVRDDAQFRALFARDPTVFYLAGRGVIAALGALTVWPAWSLARRVGGTAAGILAGVWTALSPVLIARSQGIEVDVPLACFTTFALALIIGDGRFDQPQSTRRVVLCGVVVGLAAATKYPGALALLPLLLAIAMRARGLPRRFLIRQSAIAMIAAALAFLMTSPFVLLDARAALAGIEAERVHLRLGHFGGSTGPAAWFYAGAWLDRLLGWLPGLAAIVGIAVFAFVRRRAWALVGASLVVALTVLVSPWETRHERYLLAIVPLGFVFAACALAPLLERVRGRAARGALFVALCGVGLALPTRPWLELRHRLGPDTRTEARHWIETHLAPGSFLVIEPYGPNPPSPIGGQTVPASTPPEVKDHLYWVVPMPMFQVGPERSATSYDPRLFVQADAWIVSGAVSERYRADPGRFPVQNAFYDWLEASWPIAARFAPGSGSGPEIVVHRNPAHEVPFADRVTRPVPPTEFMKRTGGNGGEATLYMGLGVNYLAFGYPREAAACFRMALSFPHATGGATREQLEGLLRRAVEREAGG